MASSVINTSDNQTIDSSHGHRVFTVKTSTGQTITPHVTLTAPAGRTGGQVQWLTDAQTELIRTLDANCATGASAHRLTTQ